jgi:hypothetical protein
VTGFIERATCYHRYTIEIYLHFLILAARNDGGATDDPQLCRTHGRVPARGDRTDGSMPQIGDADGGWLPPSPAGAGRCRGVFATAAVFFDRADFAAAACGPASEVLWLLGASGWRRLLTLQNPAPHKPQASRCSSMVATPARSGAHNSDHQLILPTSALWAVRSAAPRTRRPPEPAWRSASRISSIPAPSATRLKCSGGITFAERLGSTVVVMGRPGATEWAVQLEDPPATRLRSWESTEAFDYVDASHDGYTHLPDPVIHRRRVLFVKPRIGWLRRSHRAALHDIALRFQFAATIQRGPGL